MLSATSASVMRASAACETSAMDDADVCSDLKAAEAVPIVPETLLTLSR